MKRYKVKCYICDHLVAEVEVNGWSEDNACENAWDEVEMWYRAEPELIEEEE